MTDPNPLSSTIYAQLRQLADRHMVQERADHTLQATALVHEAYLRMGGEAGIPVADRRQFFFAAAQAMQRILVEHARARGREKRGGGWRRLTLDSVQLGSEEDSAGILALDSALRRLEEVDARAAEVVRLRFFAGLDVDQTASAMETSRRTVLRDWAWARAWLASALADGEDGPRDGPEDGPVDS